MDMRDWPTLDNRTAAFAGKTSVKEIIVKPSIKKYHRYDKIIFAPWKSWGGK
jgi:hypothetical protein